MPYILNKTNGTQLTVVDDASLDLTTNLVFVGRNYAGYGEIVNENFLKILENFADTKQPTKPILGQVWFDSSSSVKKLKVYDGKRFKEVPSIHIDSSSPDSPLTGELWWDSVNGQLKVYDGTTFLVIGPPESSRSAWKAGEEDDIATTLTIPVLKGTIGLNNVVVISNKEFTPTSESELLANFPIVKQGMTLPGADSVTGSSKNSGYILWGTSAEALTCSTASSVTVTSESTNSNFYIPFVSTSTGNLSLKTDSNFSYNPSTDTLSTTYFTGLASSARYADLAERYSADMIYDEGTVLVIGGEKEVTTTCMYADHRVIGIVSKNPAYMMNANAGSDDTHPYIALKGRVPCKVVGEIAKGDLLVTSQHPGYAATSRNPQVGTIIGKALENHSEGFGVIEVLVV